MVLALLCATPHRLPAQTANAVTVDWGSLARVIASVGVFVVTSRYAPEKRHPLQPWHLIGTYPNVNVVNLSPDSLPVHALAPAVDRATRWMGTVSPRDSAYLRIPYGDTRVTLVSPRGHTSLRVDGPKLFRWVVQ